MSAGYRVAPATLTGAANTLSDQAGRLTETRNGLAGAVPAPAAFGALPASSALSAAYGAATRAAGTTLDGIGARLTGIVTGLRGSAANYLDGDTRSASGYRSLLGADVADGASGISFADRIAANRRKVSDALADGLAKPAGQRDQHRIDLYRSILDGDRKILDFDPSGDGRIVELVGTLDADTRNVAVLVPGTTADLDNYAGQYDRARGFVDADPAHGLAVVIWQDGDFPDQLDNAASPGYSQEMAPRLAEFSHQLRSELDAAGSHAGVTVAGHSYGGAVVGLAEHDGLDADRVLYVESAGMGHDVWAPADLHDTRPGVVRYSMTAPGDPIADIQGVQLFGWGHGADPDTFPGTVDLVTGNYPDGQQIHGLAAHSGVFTPGSDAWQNMEDVFTGTVNTDDILRPGGTAH